MPTKQVEVDGCPLPSCDAPVDQAVITTEGTKLTTQNMVQEQTCLYPTPWEVDGEEVPASYIIFHRTIEYDGPDCIVADCEDSADPGAADEGYLFCEEHDTADARSLYDKRREQAAEEDDSGPDPDDLPEKARKVYDKAVEKTVGGETITLGAFKGACCDKYDDMDPSYVSETVEMLVEQGYLEEPEDAVISRPNTDD